MAEQKSTDRSAYLNPGQFYGRSVVKQRVSGLILSDLVHNEGKSLPAHSHELGFFSLLLDGAYREFYRTRTIDYEPMTITWHPPGISHRDEIGQEGGTFFTVEVQSSWLDRLREFAAVPESLYDATGGELTWLAMRLYREHKEAQLASPLVIEGVMLEMLAIATRQRMPNEKRPPLWLHRVVQRLREEFQQNLTTGDLAAEAGVHPVHLAAVFRQFHNQTVGEYQQQLRVQFAARQLGNRELPLAEIAQVAGFSDQSHLTRIFKRFSGMTPGAFRTLMSTGKPVAL
ncbi:MAG: helix-turn-helix transcriptional regulator [Acidobacteria bacterium]|nr:helix-turn-helix transcriptional regulator [Acidobacteriota bacterium]